MLRTIFFDLDDTILDFHQAEKRALAETLRSFQMEPTPAILDRYHVLNRQPVGVVGGGEAHSLPGADPPVRSAVFRIGYRLLQSGGLQGLRAIPLSGTFFYTRRSGAAGEHLIQDTICILPVTVPRRSRPGRLKSAGIEKYFKDIFISEKMGADKPSTAFFQACFAAIPGFDAADALMVGDSLTSDIRGARDAGLRSCWFNPHGATPRPDIKPDYTVRTLEELPALLERL